MRAFAMGLLAAVFICAALVMLAGYAALEIDAWRERGHRGGDKPVSEYRQPPKGPAPGVKR